VSRRVARAAGAVAGVAGRVEEALNRSGGSLRLWIVFEDEGEVAQAKALLSAAKARHVEALSSAERERRERRAFRLVAERAGAATAPPVPPEPSMPEPARQGRRRAAAPPPASRRRSAQDQLEKA
jgi:hypothetical protein